MTTNADNIEAALRDYWFEPKVSWDMYKRAGDYIAERVATVSASDEEWLTTVEVADILRLSTMTVYRMINAKKIEYIKVGKTVRISKRVLDAYLEACTTPVKETAQ